MTSLVITFAQLTQSFWQYFISQKNHLSSHIFNSIINFSTYLIILFLVIIFRQKNHRLSVCLPVFWLTNIFVTFLNGWSILNHANGLMNLEFTCTIMLFFISIFGLIITSSVQKSFVYQIPKDIEDKSYCPRSENNVFSRLIFLWVWKFLFKVYRVKLEPKRHLKPLCSYMRAKIAGKEFTETYTKWNKNSSKTRIFPVIFKTAWMSFVAASILLFVGILFTFLQPVLIGKLLDFVGGTSEPLWHGIFYSFIYCFSFLIVRTINVQVQLVLEIASFRIKAALMSAIYSKMLRLSPSSKRKFTVGVINNFMSSDTNEIYFFLAVMNQLYIAPIHTLIATYFLWQQLGPSSLALVAVMVIVGPITSLIMNKTSKMWNQQMKLKDKRMEQLTEILNNIKILKLFAWENPFLQKITETREKELKKLMLINIWNAGTDLVWGMAHIIVAISCFTLYVLTSDTIFDAKMVFVSLSVINIMRPSMAIFPLVLVRLVRSNISCRRIREYFNAEEVCLNINKDPELLNKNKGEIRINGTFSWDKNEESVLKNIDLNIEKGSLVAIVGQVGCGKSSLFSVLMGDLYQIQGNPLLIGGSIAYVPQTAWILNKTLKQNIVFLKHFDDDKYKQVVAACALEPDFEILPAKDETEIGEKGINLSGGQKQRVSLARAVYQDEDIYLLDDPLSAVDSHVAQHLFKNVVGPDGLLNGKTRLIATHHLSFLEKVDVIIVMKDGQVIGKGTFDEMAAQGLLSEVLKQSEEKNEVEEKKEEKRASTLIDSLDEENEVKKENKKGNLIEEEQQELGHVNVKNYLIYIRQFGLVIFFISLILQIAINTCEIGANYWLNLWTSNNTEIISSNEKVNLMIYAFAVFGQGFFILIGNSIIFVGALKGATKFHKNMLYSILRSPLSFFDVTPLGRILNRFSRDMSSIDQEIPVNIRFVMQSLTWFPIIFSIIWTVSGHLIFVMLIVASLFYLTNVKYNFYWIHS